MRQIGRLLQALNTFEQKAGPLLGAEGRVIPQPVNDDVRQLVKTIKELALEVRNMLPSMKSGSTEDYDDFDEEDIDSMRQSLDLENNDGSGGISNGIKSAAGGILPMLDPPLHESIFCLDVLRGTALARYKGARQLWVDRTHRHGKIDAIHIPAVGWDPTKARNTKAVLYCNPNAGLIEVSTGMSVSGGNVNPDETPSEVCWTDFYTQQGYDMYLFNYAGYGRSTGTAGGNDSSRKSGALAVLQRICHGSFLAFKVGRPRKETPPDEWDALLCCFFGFFSCGLMLGPS